MVPVISLLPLVLRSPPPAMTDCVMLKLPPDYTGAAAGAGLTLLAARAGWAGTAGAVGLRCQPSGAPNRA